VSDTVTLYGGINNGWDQLTDANKGKTVELGASIIPNKALTINVTGYSGKESAVAPGTPGGGAQDTRNLLNVVATYTINNRMSAGGEILYVNQDRPAGAAKYNGLAATSLTTSTGSGVSRRVRRCSTTRTTSTSSPITRRPIQMSSTTR